MDLLSTKQPAAAEGLVWIPGGTFLMGSDHHYPEETPAHKVKVRGFWMDPYAVTNRKFQRFIDETGHLTVAERPADAADYPGAKPELLVPSSVMFRKTAGPVDLPNPYNWWTYVAGADWRHPRGPDTSLKNSYNPLMPEVRIPRKVMKGGSYLCAPNYCRRYRPAARMAQPVDTSTCHLGFRCVIRVDDQTS